LRECKFNKFCSISGIFLQAVRTETVVIVLGDPDEVLLEYVQTFTPTILLTGAIEFLAAARTGLIEMCQFHVSGSK
jgi:hypothetical protein